MWKTGLPTLDMRAADAHVCNAVVDPRTTPNDVRNVWEEVVEAFAAPIHVEREVNAANDRPVLCHSSIRVASMMLDSVAMAGGESCQRSVDRCEMLA